MEHERTTEDYVNILMKLVNDDFEIAVCDWLTRSLKIGTINSFSDFVENNAAWLQLATMMKFKTLAFETDYFSNKNLPNYVKMLSFIWNSEQEIDVFGYFRNYLAELFNPDFDFVKNFEACLYSHTHEIVQILLVVSILTFCMIAQRENSTEQVEKLLFNLDELEEKDAKLLKKEFKQIFGMFEQIQEQFLEESKLDDSRFKTTPAQRNRNQTTVATYQIAKKVEEQQKVIDSLENENEELKGKAHKLEIEVSDKDRIIEEQEMKIKQLNFSRTDMLEKLKNKKFDMINEEIADKEREIHDLKERIGIIEAKYQQRLKDAEEAKDSMELKVHQLENYKVEFENLKKAFDIQKSNVQNMENSITTEELEKYEKLKDQYYKLQEATLEDKQKYLELEMNVSELNMKIQKLTLENQDLQFKVQEMEDNASLIGSEVYVEDYEEIKEELSVANHLKKYTGETAAEDELNLQNELNKKGEVTPFEITENKENGDTGEENEKEILANKTVKKVFRDYEKKCLHRIKMMANEIREYKTKLDEVLVDLEETKDENDELVEKTTDLENRVVNEFIRETKELREMVYDGENRKDSSDIAQDLLKNIVKKDYEIARMRINRKKQLKEMIGVEAKCTEKIDMLYTILATFLNLDQEQEERTE